VPSERPAKGIRTLHDIGASITTNMSKDAQADSSKQPESEQQSASKGDCPWCLYMKGGPCKEVFVVSSTGAGAGSAPPHVHARVWFCLIPFWALPLGFAQPQPTTHTPSTHW
jgi:hypothetical protein